MNILLFTDPHITPKAEFSQPTSDGLTEYLHRCIKSFEWLGSLVDKYKPDAVICGGDVTDTTGYVDSVTLKVATKLFSELSTKITDASGKHAQLHILVGNHDAYSVPHKIHNLCFLEPIEGINVLTEPSTVVVPSRKGERYEFCAIPWIEEFKEDLSGLYKNAQFIVTHLDVEGGLLYKKKAADFGVSKSSFGSVPVFNGHMHLPSEVSDTFTNVGALISRNFADVDSPPRGAILIKLSENKKLSWNRIPNPHDVAFKDIIIKDATTAENWSKLLESGVTGYEDSYVRIKYNSEYKDIAESIGYLSQGCRTVPISVQSTQSIDLNESVNVSGRGFYLDYMDNSGLEKERLDRIKELGLNYIDDVEASEVTHTLPIEFLSLKAKHFQSLGEIELDLSEPGLVYVEGINEDDPYDANGVGKSTIHEAIYWTLIGKSLRGYTGNGVIHWDHDYCFTELEFNVGSSSYKVIRARKHPEYGSNAYLFTKEDNEWVDISARRKNDTSSSIRELLGRSDKVLQHSVFLTAGLANRFTALSYPARIKLIEEVINVGVFESAEKAIRNDLRKVQSELYSVRGSLEQDIKNKEKTQESIETLDKEIESLVASTESSSIKFKSQLAEVLKRVELAEYDVKKSEYNLNKLLEKKESIQNELSPIESLSSSKIREYSNLEVKLKMLVQQYKEYGAIVRRGDCVSCGQKITGDAPVTTKLLSSKKEIAATKSLMNELKLEVDSYKEELSRVRKSIVRIDESIKTYNRTVFDSTRLLTELNNTKQSILNSMKELRNSSNDLKSRRATYNDMLESTIDSINRLALKESQISTKYEDLLWLSEAFHTTGIRAELLFRNSLPYLNSRLVEYSTKLGQPCRLDWKENKKGELEDKIDVVFESKRTYQGASRGERMMVDLAVQFAFNDLAIATGGSRVNLLVTDEVIDHLDDTSVKNVVDILKDKSEDIKILLMAHRPFLDSIIPNKLRLVKRFGITELQ